MILAGKGDKVFQKDAVCSSCCVEHRNGYSRVLCLENEYLGYRKVVSTADSVHEAVEINLTNLQHKNKTTIIRSPTSVEMSAPPPASDNNNNNNNNGHQ